VTGQTPDPDIPQEREPEAGADGPRFGYPRPTVRPMKRPASRGSPPDAMGMPVRLADGPVRRDVRASTWSGGRRSGYGIPA